VSIALAHDYLTQRGGAERVALIMVRAFPDVPLHTTLYEPAGTFPEFAKVDVRVSPLNGITPCVAIIASRCRCSRRSCRACAWTPTYC
jgi:hypothetical protein